MLRLLNRVQHEINRCLDDIEIPSRLRRYDLDRAEHLAASMREIGLRTPITLRVVIESDAQRVILVAGRHRLEAAKLLGWRRF